MTHNPDPTRPQGRDPRATAVATSSRALLALVPLVLQGCAPGWAGAPRVPNPVLLGPVDRVGGHRAARGLAVGAVDDEVDRLAAVSRSEHQEGRLLVRETDAVALFDGSAKWSPAILKATAGARDVDVRVHGVELGCYAFLTPWSAILQTWVRLRGDAVRASSAP